MSQDYWLKRRGQSRERSRWWWQGNGKLVAGWWLSRVRGSTGRKRRTQGGNHNSQREFVHCIPLIESLSVTHLEGFRQGYLGDKEC